MVSPKYTRGPLLLQIVPQIQIPQLLSSGQNVLLKIAHIHEYIFHEYFSFL